jgi:hypothetical protein
MCPTCKHHSIVRQKRNVPIKILFWKTSYEEEYRQEYCHSQGRIDKDIKEGKPRSEWGILEKVPNECDWYTPNRVGQALRDGWTIEQLRQKWD